MQPWPPSSSRTSSLTQKETRTHWSPLFTPHIPSLWQTVILLPSLGICLFWLFRIHGFLKCDSLCLDYPLGFWLVWLFCNPGFPVGLRQTMILRIFCCSVLVAVQAISICLYPPMCLHPPPTPELTTVTWSHFLTESGGFCCFAAVVEEVIGSHAEYLSARAKSQTLSDGLMSLKA